MFRPILIIFVEKKSFIQEISIKYYVHLASAVANVMHQKAFGCNLALKIDIVKAFDTHEWPFFIKVIRL